MLRNIKTYIRSHLNDYTSLMHHEEISYDFLYYTPDLSNKEIWNIRKSLFCIKVQLFIHELVKP